MTSLEILKAAIQLATEHGDNEVADLVAEAIRARKKEVESIADFLLAKDAG